jgi:taurine dioxygenase
MAMTDMPEQLGLETEPLHPMLGAAVRGLDLRKPLSPEIFAAVHTAWMAHLVLVFPDQPISDGQKIAFARMFGELETHHQDIIKSARAPEIFRVSNVDDDGNLMQADHPIVAQISLAQRWHTDSSYRATPSMGSILHGVEVTEEGGETCFTNMYKVYKSLPDKLRQAIGDHRLRHDVSHLTTLAPIKPLSEEERAAMPPVWQPMRRRHPLTERTSLYISPIYNDAIEGMADEQAVDLVAELAEFAGRLEFVYHHRWSKDDVVMWDNRYTMHRVTPYDLGEHRVMHRTTIVGDGPVIAA